LYPWQAPALVLLLEPLQELAQAMHEVSEETLDLLQVSENSSVLLGASHCPMVARATMKRLTEAIPVEARSFRALLEQLLMRVQVLAMEDSSPG
jgi:hypothetical protein